MGGYVPKAPIIRRDQRVFVVGTSGCGKSEVVMHLLRAEPGQIVVLDPKSAITIPGAQVVYGNPALIDWRHRVIIYRPIDPTDYSPTGEVNRLCKMIWERCPEKGRGLTFWVDESGDICTSTTGPFFLEKIAKQGRSHNIRMFVLAQQPVHVLKAIVRNANHIILFAQVLADDDEKTLMGTMAQRTRKRVGGKWVALPTLNDRIEWLSEHFRTSDDPEKDLGRFASIHWHRESRIMIARPPLPKRFVGRPIVARTDPPGVHRAP